MAYGHLIEMPEININGVIHSLSNGCVELSQVRWDFMRKSPRYPGGTYEGDGSEDCQMNIVGTSGSPTYYAWGPSENQDWQIHHIHVRLQDEAAQFIATNFGGLSPLATGCQFRLNRRVTSIVRNLGKMTCNACWVKFAGVNSIRAAYGSGDDVLQVDWKFGSEAEKFILIGNAGDVLEVAIQDDLSGLSKFSMYVTGHQI